MPSGRSTDRQLSQLKSVLSFNLKVRYTNEMQGPQTINESYYCLRNKPDGPVSVLTTNSYVVGEYDVRTGDIRWGRVVLASQKVQIQNYLHRHFPPTSNNNPTQKNQIVAA